MTKRIQSYKEQFNQLFNGDPWLDESFSKKLDHLTDEQVFKPAPGNNHSVAEVVSHLLVWRREIIRRVTENSPQRLLTDESPDNWKSLAQLQQAGWQVIYDEFKQTQYSLEQLLESKDDSFLEETLAGTEHNKEYFIAGLLHHDAYHLGQIGLIAKWAK